MVKKDKLRCVIELTSLNLITSSNRKTFYLRELSNQIDNKKTQLNLNTNLFQNSITYLFIPTLQTLTPISQSPVGASCLRNTMTSREFKLFT